jgi:hypothetical protein
MGGGLEVDVPLPPFAAFAEHKLGSRLGEIGHGLNVLDDFSGFLVLDLGAAGDERTGWYFEDDVLARFTSAHITGTSGTIRRDEATFEKEGLQAVGAGINFQNDIATPAAIATVRPALRTELTPMEMN